MTLNPRSPGRLPANRAANRDGLPCAKIAVATAACMRPRGIFEAVASLEERKVWDTQPQTVKRYEVQQMVCPFEVSTEPRPGNGFQGTPLRMGFETPSTVVLKADRERRSPCRPMRPSSVLQSILFSLPDEWKLICISTDQEGNTRHIRITPG